MKSRRGISSVVGTVFAVIALSSTVGYVTYSMTVLDSYNQSVLAKNQVATDLLNEKFQVSSVTYANNKFNITVTNTGSLPVNFTKIWITNSSVAITSSWVKNYAPKTSVLAPGNTLKNIGQNICNQCSFNLSKAYHIKLVTSRGNTNEFDVNSASTAPLNIQLLANPNSVTSGFNTTLVMLVTNNQTGAITNITPQALSNSNPGVCTLGSMSPSTYGVLSSGNTAVFQWNVKASGIGQSCTFNATLTNGYINPTTKHIQNVITTVKVSPTIPISTGPLSIQLLALPPTTPSGFKMQLVMVVTNNQTGTLQNIIPNTPTNSNAAECTLGTVSPSQTNTLPPGGTAIFMWSVTVNGVSGDTCTFSLTQPLQGGYMQTVSATLTITAVNIGTTTYAQDAGVLTDNYTNFRWTQGSSWKTDWSFPHGSTTDFKMTIANNNQTAGGYKLWLSKQTQIYLLQTALPSNGKIVAYPFFLVSAMPSNPPTPPTLSDYNDYSIGIPNGGGVQTLYFGSDAAGDNNQQTSLQAGTYFGFVLVYGKFTVNSGDNTGGNYAQAIPFLAVVAT